MYSFRRQAALSGGVLTALIAAGLLGGCGSKDQPAAGATSNTRASRKAAPVVSPGMVSAVSGAQTGNARVQLKFELHARPMPAQPLDIDMAILPGSANLDRIYGRIEASDGLQLADGAVIAPTDRPLEGTPIRHSIQVLPQRDGIFTVNTVISIESGGQTSTQAFTIPVIVGAGLPDLPTKPASTAASTKPAAGH